MPQQDSRNLELSYDGSPWVRLDMTRDSHELELSYDGSPWTGFFIPYVHSPDYAGGYENTNGGFDD